MAHKTLINGTEYEITGGKTLVNGTEYSISNGKTLVDGTEYDISFVTGTPISELAVGESVWMNVNGTAYEWLVVNQGIPSNSSLYDSSCDGTWLLMKDVYTKRTWGSSNTNYANSDIHSYLNNTFLGLFDSNIQSTIKQVKIPYCTSANSGTVVSSSNGLSTKIFLLSIYECDRALSGDPKDGACLSYFDDADVSDCIAYYNGTATGWWIRSLYYYYGSAACLFSKSGAYTCSDSSSSYGIRPALILPSDTLIDDDGFVTV